MASWKKVVLQGANITDAALVATEASVTMNADSILFVDGDSKIKRDTVADFATGLAGTATTTGLVGANGTVGLKTDLGILGSLVNSGGDGTEDFVIVYDQSASQWKKALASTVGSAGTDTNTTYAISSSTSGNESTITLTAGGSGSGTDTIKLSGDDDITLTQSGTPEDISIALDAGLTGVSSIFNTNIEIGADTNNKIDFGANSNKIDVTLDSTGQFTIENGAMVPAAADLFDIGSSGTFMKKGFFKDLQVTNAITGSVTGSAGSAGTATTVSTSATDSETTVYIAGFINSNSSAQTPQVTSGIHFDSSTDKITAVGFVGALTGTADNATNAVDATNADNVAIADRNSSGNNQYFVFSEGTTGDQGLGVDANFYYVPSTDTLNVQNLVVSGTETKVNTTNLSVTDKIIEIANGSADGAAADGAGIQVNIAEVVLNEAEDNGGAVATSFAKMPELKWNNGGSLAGWTISDYNSSSANEDFAIPTMKVASAAPSGANNQAGAGSFYTDTSSGTEGFYVYL